MANPIKLPCEYTPFLIHNSTPGPATLALVPTSGAATSTNQVSSGSSLVPVTINTSNLAPGRTVANVSGNNVVLVQQQSQQKGSSRIVIEVRQLMNHSSQASGNNGLSSNISDTLNNTNPMQSQIIVFTPNNQTATNSSSQKTIAQPLQKELLQQVAQAIRASQIGSNRAIVLNNTSISANSLDSTNKRSNATILCKVIGGVQQQDKLVAKKQQKQQTVASTIIKPINTINSPDANVDKITTIENEETEAVTREASSPFTNNDKDGLKLSRKRPIYETDDLIRELSPPIEGTEDPSTIIGPDGTINGRKPVQCNICKRYMPESRLANHIRHLHDNRPSVNPKKNFKCDHCGKQFTIRYTYQQHVKTHTQGRPKCPECGTTFASAFSLFRHRAKNHGIEHNYKTHNCDQCNKTFFSLSELKLHQQRHSADKEFKCQECNKAFSVKGNLRIHMRTHAKEKLFKCDICGNSFSHPYSLVSHRRIHTNDCPHKCPHCDKAYRAKHQLTSHMIVHTDLRPFKCEQCPKTFRSRTAFKMHQDEHKGIKRFTCKFCDRQFQCYGNKLKHERRHIGEKKHKCSFCDKAFIEKQELKNHLKIHEKNQKSISSSDIVDSDQPTSSNKMPNARPTKTTLKKNTVQNSSISTIKMQQPTKDNNQTPIGDALDISNGNVNNQTSGTTTFYMDAPNGSQFNRYHQQSQTNSSATDTTLNPMQNIMIMNTNEGSQQHEAQSGVSSNMHHTSNISNDNNALLQAYHNTLDVQISSSGHGGLSQMQSQSLNQHIDQSGDQYQTNAYTTSSQQSQQWHQNDVQQTSANPHTNMHCHPSLVASQMNIRFALNSDDQQQSTLSHGDPYGQRQQSQQLPQQLQHRSPTAGLVQHIQRTPIHLQQHQIETSRSVNQQTTNNSGSQQQSIQQHQQQPINLPNSVDGNQGASRTSEASPSNAEQQVSQTTSVNGGRQFHRNQHVACRLCKQLVADIRHHLIIFHRVELGNGEDISSWFTSTAAR